MAMVLDHGPEKTSHRFVMVALANFCDDNGYCWPAMDTIAKKVCMSERGVRKIVRELEADGWLSVDVGGGRRGCNEYRLNPERGRQNPEPRSPRNHVPPGTRVHETRNESAQNPEPRSPEPSRTIIEPSEEETTKDDADLFGAQSEPLPDEPKPDPISEGFERFWGSWPSHPRKKQRVDCEKVYRSACLGKHSKFDGAVTPDQLNEAAQRYFKTVRDQQFLKGTLAWLREPGFEPFISATASAFRPYEELNPNARSALEAGRVPPSMQTPDGKPNAEAAHHLRRFGYEVPE